MTNNVELSIIKYILIYSIYIKYNKYINISKDLKEIYILFNTIKLLHHKYPETDKTVDELEIAVLQEYPRLNKDEVGAIRFLCEQLRETEVRDEIVEELLSSLRKRDLARELAIASLDYCEGRPTESKMLELYQQLAEISENITEENNRNFVTSDLRELHSTTLRGVGLDWPMTTLNISLGPLRKGDFGFVFARPETGKTTFLAHVAAHMSRAADKYVLWFNNEEQGDKVRVRTYQAALGLTTDQLFSDLDGNQERYLKLTGDRIKIYDDASISRADVERVIREHPPSLCIFDQIDKITGFNADRPDLVFGRIYQWARELAKLHCPVIGTCQADGQGEGVRWLTMSHVAEAKTSKQAEADWILGIGRSNEAGTESVRYFNISKNKLMGSEHTDPELRHGRFEVFIRPQIAQYQDIVE